MKRKLTQAMIEKIAPPKTGRIEIFDSTLPAFGLRLSSSGAKSWFVMFRVHGKLRRHTIGNASQITLKDARALARAAFEAVASGQDPGAQKRAARRPADEDATFLGLWKAFRTHLEREGRSASTVADYKRYINGPFTSWHDRPAASITSDEVFHKIDAWIEAGKVARATNGLAVLRSMYGWAKQRRRVPVNPATDIQAVKPRARERVLSDDEIRAVWTGAQALGYPFGPLAQILLLTGQRLGEVAGMRWTDVDLKTGIWTQATAKGDPQVLPLPDAAVNLIEALPRVGEYVFATRKDRPVSGLSKAKARLDDLCGVLDWRLHDLRRSVRTNLPRVGVDPDTAERVLGHRLQGVRAIYDRWSYADEKGAALRKWAALLASIVADEPANVVAIRG
jgi:integrase